MNSSFPLLLPLFSDLFFKVDGEHTKHQQRFKKHHPAGLSFLLSEQSLCHRKFDVLALEKASY